MKTSPADAVESATLTIRDATETDLEAILALYVEGDLETGPQLPPARGREIFAQMRGTPGYRLCVAEDDGRLVGSFALLVMPNLGHQGSPSGIVEDVVVAPQCQGRGIGRAMMRWAADRCREAGCYKLVLSSNTRRTPAHAFYEGLGFTRHGYSFRLEL